MQSAIVLNDNGIGFSDPFQHRTIQLRLNVWYIATGDKVAIGRKSFHGCLHASQRTSIKKVVLNHRKAQQCQLLIISTDRQLITNGQQGLNAVINQGFTTKDENALSLPKRLLFPPARTIPVIVAMFFLRKYKQNARWK